MPTTSSPSLNELQLPSVELVDAQRAIKHLELLLKNEEHFVEAYAQLRHDLRAAGCNFLKAGCTRQGWTTPNGLICKIPLIGHSKFANAHNTATNIIEGSSERVGDMNRIPLARTALVWHETGIPIVVMERVKPLTRSQVSSSMHAMTIHRDRMSDKQVGFTHDGRIVAYDFGGYRPAHTEHFSFIFDEYGITYSGQGCEYHIVKIKN